MNVESYKGMYFVFYGPRALRHGRNVNDANIYNEI